MSRYFFIFCLVGLFLSGCATVEKTPKKIESSATKQQQRVAQEAVVNKKTKPVLKRKIAIGRFSNETRYGRSLLVDENNDPLGKQVADILASRLVDSGKFIVLERPDITKLKKEEELSGQQLDIVGVDTMIFGSLTQLGNSVSGKTGFLSSTKRQQAEAAVELRLVDTRTGHVFFTAQGAGVASTETGEVAGFGNKANYDGTLNDKAINAAISEVINKLISKLDEKSWRSYILSTENNVVFISGGKKQGLVPGMKLAVMNKGKIVKSQQTGFAIELPGTKIAEIIVNSSFGEDESTEGSICSFVSGNLDGYEIGNLFISEIKK